jgi:urease accessory protein
MKKQSGDLPGLLNMQGTIMSNLNNREDKKGPEKNEVKKSGTGLKKNQLYELMFIHDSAFPTGSYAHSFGMETYIQSGKIKDEEDLFSFCQSYLINNLACGEGIFLKEVYQTAREGLVSGEINWEQIIELEHRCHIFKATAELRKASLMMGKQFLKAVRALYNYPLLEKWQELIITERVYGDYAVNYGLLMAAMGIELEIALGAFLYSTISALVYNAIRAVPLGQQAGISVLYRLLPLCGEMARSITEKDQGDIYNQTPALDIASIQHQHLYTRLFIS